MNFLITGITGFAGPHWTDLELGDLQVLTWLNF